MRGLLQAAVIALALCGKAAAQEPSAPSGPGLALTPGDFLDNVGKQAKARWRQLYRAGPPAAPSERPRVAFMLGALVGDSYLAQKAGDAQQFKNTNQDLLNFCRVLGMGEKATPGFLSAAKAAEREEWPAEKMDVKHLLCRLSAPGKGRGLLRRKKLWCNRGILLFP